MQFKVTVELCSGSENEAKCHWGSISGLLSTDLVMLKCQLMVGDTLVKYIFKRPNFFKFWFMLF